jgi:hypothetical protein
LVLAHIPNATKGDMMEPEYIAALKAAAEKHVGSNPTIPTNTKCDICNKEICDDEFVVNWGSCSDCFNFNYERYLQTSDKFDYDEA